jgi:hypothetical protein
MAPLITDAQVQMLADGEQTANSYARSDPRAFTEDIIRAGLPTFN